MENDNGLHLTLDYQNINNGYVYIRQIIRNIYRFEGKKISLEIKYNLINNFKKDLYYDIYIQSRFNKDNSSRALVSDTLSQRLLLGNNKIKIEFNVPTFNNYGKVIIDKTEGLSVAFRLIGKKQEANIVIKEIKLEILK